MAPTTGASIERFAPSTPALRRVAARTGRLIVVGGDSAFGRAITAAAADRFDIVLAGTRTDELRSAARELDVAAAVTAVDERTASGIERVARTGDLVIDAAGLDTDANLLRAAIAGGFDYADAASRPRTIATRLTLDAAAQHAGTAALIGVGLAPGISGLLARLSVTRLRDGGHDVHKVIVGTLMTTDRSVSPEAMERILDGATEERELLSDGHLIRSVPFRRTMALDFPGAGTFAATEFAGPESFFLRSTLEVDSVEGYLALRPAAAGRFLGRVAGGPRRRRAASSDRGRRLIDRSLRRLGGSGDGRVAAVGVAIADGRQVAATLAGRGARSVEAACAVRILAAWDRERVGVHLPDSVVEPAAVLANPGSDRLEVTATDTVTGR